jgi:nitrogen regulatory protein PII
MQVAPDHIGRLAGLERRRARKTRDGGFFLAQESESPVDDVVRIRTGERGEDAV